MNKIISVSLLLLVAITSPALALTAVQKISAVTVYPDRALVTRSGTVKLDAGVQSIVFDNLPVNLEEDSVRAKAQGKLKILGVEVRRDYKEAAVSAGTKQLQDDITSIDDQIQSLNDEKVDLGRREQFMDRIKETASANIKVAKDESAPVQNTQALFQLYSTETTKITTRSGAITIALRGLNKQREDKENKLSLLQQPTAPNTRSAVVTVEAADAGTVDLQVSYLISGAGWQPQYDAYADPDTQKVELTYYGIVRQTTGENWDDVALILSSARPSTAARLPELAAWTVDFAGTDNGMSTRLTLEDAKYRSINAARANNSMVMNGTAQITAGNVDLPAAATPSMTLASNAEMQTAEVRTLGPSATFVVPAKASIPSDNQPHRSAISVQNLKGEWTYVATPKLVPGAFLKTRVTNSSGGPLLGGDINAFLGNNFIGKSNIGLVAANASFDLYLGVDENIKITRTEGVKKEEIGGIITRQKIYKRSFTIEVQNFKAEPISFKLRDQLPVSKNGKIAVVVNRQEPAFKSRDEDTGEIAWELKLKPNEKQKITVEYEIDAPSEQVVAGM